MPSIPPYPIEIPTSLLHHSLNRLDRNESERVIGAQAGKTPRRAEGGDAYSSCSYSIEKSSDRANLRDNRWANIFSFDHSLLPGRYLNASLIPPFPCEGGPSRRSYIASQAPLPHTLPVFYSAVIEHDVALIVNLTAFTERGRVKSDVYWPMDKEQEWSSTKGYRIVRRGETQQISSLKSDLSEAICYRLRVVETGGKGREHDVDLLHITTWPDFGAFPEKIFTELLAMIDAAAKDKAGPMWVHCSAGIGRSGTVIASLLARDLGPSLLPALQLEHPISTPALVMEGALKGAEKMVDHERRYRPKMVQTADQLGMVASEIGRLLQQL